MGITLLQILARDSDGHLVLNRYTYLINFLSIHYYLIELIYIHDYMGPGPSYVNAACCTILRYGGPYIMFDCLIHLMF